jgi:hypothetical protein
MNHLARFAAYKIALREGQLPPRFAGNLLNHYGYPVLNFNYPLANILALPLAFAHVSYEFILKMQMVAGIACGALGFIVWMREWGRSKGAIVFAVLLWISAPFLLNILYVRGNIGELWATALWPWLWVALLRWLRVQRVSRKEMVLWFGVWSAFWLAHNLYSVFGALVVIGGVGWVLLQQLRRTVAGVLPARLAALRSAVIVGGSWAVAAWFWIPALWEKRWTVVDTAGVNQLVLQHFPSVEQLLSSAMTFGFSLNGPVDGLSLQIGWLWLVLLGLTTFALARRAFVYAALQAQGPARSAQHYLLVFLCVVCWGAVVSQLAITTPIWQMLFSVAKFWQFPWRLSFFVVGCGPVLFATIFDQVNSHYRVLLCALAVSVFLVVTKIQPVDRFHHLNVAYEAFSETTSTQHENRTTLFTFQHYAHWQPGPMVLPVDASASEITAESTVDGSVPKRTDIATANVEEWSGTAHRYTLVVHKPALIIEPTMWFPGWSTRITHTVEPSLPTEQPDLLAQAKRLQGRVGFAISPGTYTVSTRFTQDTPARWMGNALSLIAILAIGAMVTFHHKMKAFN